MEIIKNMIELIRPHQYTKNLFIFLPLFFAFQLANTTILIKSVVAFIAFSLIASSVYIINDWFDCDQDRSHPRKKNRPLAAGKISVKTALILMLVLLMLGCGCAYIVSIDVMKLLLIYFFINITYSLYFKHVAIIDISILSLFFVFRIFVGKVATGVYLSHWIVVITFLLALFLALAKRRDDFLIYLNSGEKSREVINNYNLRFLDSAMIMSASIVIVAYILWSISLEVINRLNSDKLYLTALFVVMGILRYMQITFVENKSGNPSRVLLHDRFLQFVLLGWILTFVWILYLT